MLGKTSSSFSPDIIGRAVLLFISKHLFFHISLTSPSHPSPHREGRYFRSYSKHLFFHISIGLILHLLLLAGRSGTSEKAKHVFFHILFAVFYSSLRGFTHSLLWVGKVEAIPSEKLAVHIRGACFLLLRRHRNDAYMPSVQEWDATLFNSYSIARSKKPSKFIRFINFRLINSPSARQLLFYEVHTKLLNQW